MMKNMILKNRLRNGTLITIIAVIPIIKAAVLRIVGCNHTHSGYLLKMLDLPHWISGKHER